MVLKRPTRSWRTNLRTNVRMGEGNYDHGILGRQAKPDEEWKKMERIILSVNKC